MNGFALFGKVPLVSTLGDEIPTRHCMRNETV